MKALAAAASALALMTASAAVALPANAQVPVIENSIQKETTISLNGKGSTDRAPDMATISLGVNIEAKTASDAMKQQAQLMDGVFKAVKAAGVADRDMQTSSLSLNPVYDYQEQGGAVLRGYSASNQIAITVRDLKKLGATLDSIVKAGGNTINGISFGIEEDREARDAARIEAIRDAARKADLYAAAVGYSVKRIVTVTENEYDYQPPMPMMARMEMKSADASTPIASGEVTIQSSVSVTFELVKK
jgi:uncharacterized protein YggE